MAERKSSVILELKNRIGGPLREMRRQVHHATRDVRRRFARLGQSLRRFGTGIAALGVGIGYTAQRMITSVADTADELAKMSRQLGVSVQSLQRWRFIANRQGVDQGKLNQSLIAFSKRLGEARAGTGALTTYLKKANPELLDQLTHTKSINEAFRIYLAALDKTPDKADQAAAASAAFSRQGVALIRLVDGGFKNFDKLGDTFDRLKGGITAQDAHAAERYKDAMADLGTALTGAKYAVVGGSFDSLTQTIQRFTQYIVTHRADIDRWSKQFAEKLPGRIQQTANAVKQAAQAIKNVVDLLGGWKNTMYAVIGVMAAPFVAGVAGAVLAIGKMIGALVTATKKAKGLRGELAAMRGMRGLGFLGKAGLIGAAGAGGYAAGSYINKHYVDGTGVGDAVGKSVAQVMALFGSKDAQAALDNSPQAQAAESKRRADRLTAELQRRRAQVAAQNQTPLMMQNAGNGAAGASTQPVNGQISIRIDSEGRPRVQRVDSEGPVDLNVDAGLLMMGGG